MPLTLTAKEANALWETEGAATRRHIQQRVDYYEGRHAILKREEYYADGKPKANRVVNWVRSIVNRYVGLITAQPFSVSATDDETDADGSATVTAYREAVEANALPALDVKLILTSLIAGYAVEMHEFVDGEHTIRFADPSEWHFIKDAYGNDVGAIRKCKVKAGTYYDGAVLTEDMEVLSIYDDTTISDFKKSAKDTEWTPIAEPVAHSFPSLPLVAWSVDDARRGIITDTLIRLSDEYNEIFSSAGDEVRREVDALLKITNCDGNWLVQNATVIKEQRVLPLAEGADANYIGRPIDTTPTVEQLTRAREAIHVEGEVPDVASITGATGDTSGIALKLKFMPMLQAAGSMTHQIKACLRERIALLITREGQVTGQQPDAGVNINIALTLPTNRIEEWQAIGSLTGIVSHKKQLELLSDVHDPDAELARIAKEGRADAKPTIDNAVASKDARVAEGAVEATPDYKALVAGMSNAITDHMIQTGAIERLVASKQEQAS